MEEEKKKTKDSVKNNVDTEPQLDEEERKMPSAAERIKRSRALQRRRSKLKIGRARAVSRKASTKELYDRARRAVVRNMKRDFAGGRNPRELSAAEKERVERQVQRKKGFVDNAVTRMMKTMRQKESERLNKGVSDKEKEIKKDDKKNQDNEK